MGGEWENELVKHCHLISRKIGEVDNGAREKRKEGGEKRVDRAHNSSVLCLLFNGQSVPSGTSLYIISSQENSVPERILSVSALSSYPRVRLISRVNSPFKRRITDRSHIISISKENSGLHNPHSVLWRNEDDCDRPRCRPNYLAERQPRHRQSLFASRLADESSIVRPPGRPRMIGSGEKCKKSCSIITPTDRHFIGEWERAAKKPLTLSSPHSRLLMASSLLCPLHAPIAPSLRPGYLSRTMQ